MTDWQSFSIESMTSLYLYGTVTPPTNIATRLRTSDIESITIAVDAQSVMASVGRFANLFQTDIVRAFFDGSLDLSTFQTSAGTIDASFGQIIAGNIVKPGGGHWSKADGDVAINQYTTDTNSSDWPLRAFISGRQALRSHNRERSFTWMRKALARSPAARCYRTTTISISRATSGSFKA